MDADEVVAYFGDAEDVVRDDESASAGVLEFFLAVSVWSGWIPEPGDTAGGVTLRTGEREGRCFWIGGKGE